MRITGEYIKCSCGGWARVERAEDHQHRDRLVCARCGSITIADNIPRGEQLRLKEGKIDD